MSKTLQAVAGGFATAASAMGLSSTVGQPISFTYGPLQESTRTHSGKVEAGGALKMDEAMLNAKLEGVEARTETKFAQLIGKMDLFFAGQVALEKKVDAVDRNTRASKSIIISTIIAAAISIVGLTFAGISILSNGMNVTAGAYQAGMAAAQSTIKPPAANTPSTGATPAKP